MEDGEEMSNGRPINPNNRVFLEQTLARLVEKKQGLKDNTLKSYRERFISVINHLEDMQIPVDPEKLRILDGKRFVDELWAEELNANTRADYTYTLRTYAQVNGNDALDNLPDYITNKPKYRTLSFKEVNQLLETNLLPELEIVLHLMLFYGGSEKDLTQIKVSDIDFEKETVTLRPLPGCDTPRIQKFMTMANGRTSRQVFDEYMTFRRTLVKWIRLNNKEAAIPEELLVYDLGMTIQPFNEDSTSMTNRLREISRISGVHLTEGLLLKTYSRNLTYRDKPLEELENLAAIKIESTQFQEAV